MRLGGGGTRRWWYSAGRGHSGTLATLAHSGIRAEAASQARCWPRCGSRRQHAAAATALRASLGQGQLGSRVGGVEGSCRLGGARAAACASGRQPLAVQRQLAQEA